MKIFKNRRRLDESLSGDCWKKCMTGKPNAEIDIEKIKISPDGIIRLKKCEVE